MPHSPRYVDHPAPGVAVMLLMILTIAAMFLGAASLVQRGGQVLGWVVLAVVVGSALFYMWVFYTTYYTVDAEGIQVRYGPWKRRYPWSDFSAAFWQKGMFGTRIGWPSVTPCVRLTDAVLLKRKARWLGLYLTPNDSRAFLAKIAELAPELTRETVL
jgi:hypothetical protein